MTSDVYERLARHLDKTPPGYPRTESGVEMRILRRLFAPEDAELTLHLTLIPEEPRVIARRAKISVAEAGERLAEMEQKGLIFGVSREGRPPLYQVLPIVVGFWEFQVNKLDRELVEDFEEYLPTLGDPELWRKAPQLRTIPVGESISAATNVMSYEQAEALVRAHDTFSVAECICRKEMEVLDRRCDKPLEICMGFGMMADHAVRIGIGRPIDRDEALANLHRAEQAGLVLQPSNAKDAAFLCACCGCCCGVLRLLKLDPNPARVASSAFVAALSVETCEGCGTCETRCQMEAVYLDNGTATLDLDRCIGCGLCVTTCPSESLSLVRKPETEQPYVPKDIVDTLIKVGQARGMYGMGELIGMQVRSKVDRLLAPSD